MYVQLNVEWFEKEKVQSLFPSRGTLRKIRRLRSLLGKFSMSIRTMFHINSTHVHCSQVARICWHECALLHFILCFDRHGCHSVVLGNCIKHFLQPATVTTAKSELLHLIQTYRKRQHRLTAVVHRA